MIINRSTWTLAFALVMLYSTSIAQGGEPIKIALFDVDATPPVGSSMAYQPVRRIDEMTLRCRGIVILGC